MPGPISSESTESLKEYQQCFGDDYYTFWFALQIIVLLFNANNVYRCGGSKFIILNSSIYLSQEAELIADKTQQQSI